LIPVIVVTWNESTKLVKVEGNVNGFFVVAVGRNEFQAMQRWRKESGYQGEVKR